MKLSLQSFLSNSVVRWWIVGIGFTVASIPMLHIFEKDLHVAKWIASIIVSELLTLLRYFANDRWVFGHARPSWVRLWQYHVANFGSFVLWVIVYNLLGYLLKIEGPWAVLIATALSVGLSMATNFLWIWRSKASRSHQPAPSDKSKTRSQLSLKNRRDYWRL